MDANGHTIFANMMAEKNTGSTFDEMIGNTPRLWGGLMSAEFYKDIWHKKRQIEGYGGQITNRRKNGQLYTVIAHISPIFGSQKQVIGYVGTEEDVTHFIALERKLSQVKKRDDALLLSLGEEVIATKKKWRSDVHE